MRLSLACRTFPAPTFHIQEWGFSAFLLSTTLCSACKLQRGRPWKTGNLNDIQQLVKWPRAKICLSAGTFQDSPFSPFSPIRR